MFYEKDVLRNFAEFTGKHLCQSLFFDKVAGLRPWSTFGRLVLKEHFTSSRMNESACSLEDNYVNDSKETLDKIFKDYDCEVPIDDDEVGGMR